jgi:hypothetical protein
MYRLDGRVTIGEIVASADSSQLGRLPPVAKAAIAAACFGFVALIVGSCVYMIAELESAINSLPNTDELRAELKREFPAGTPLTEVRTYLELDNARYDVSSGNDVDEYFQTLGLTQGTKRSQVASVVDAVVAIQGGLFASARVLFYFDSDDRLVRLVVCQEYDCAA